MALLSFVALLVVAVPVVLLGLGHYHWFFRDDFSFLSGREATSLHDLFEPHNSHWLTVPVLWFRGLYALFGLRSYVPYQASVLLLHLSSCALLRVIMRRVGVSPWIATAAAGAFVFFGPGQQNIIWAFQISFTGSLAFGLAQLVLADHDGPLDRRDALGVFMGLLSLMSSSVGIAMAVVVGLATFGRRGWKAALVHVTPLAVAYGVYTVAESPDPSSPYGRPTAAVLFRWVRSGQVGVFEALGHFTIVAALLAIVLVAGLVFAWSRMNLTELRRRAALPAAMLLGGIVFSAFTGTGRWYNGSEFARSSRYVHIGTALALPAIAVAADALARRWRLLTVPLIVLLLIAVPWNIDAFHQKVFGPSYMAARKRVITNITRLPEAREVPRRHRPIPDAFVSPTLTMGWLLDAQAAGKLPKATTPLTPELENDLLIRLAIDQGGRAFPGPCTSYTDPLDITTKKGTKYVITKPITIATRDGGHLTSPPVAFAPGFDGNIITMELSGIELRLQAPAGRAAFELCDVGPDFPHR